MSLKLTTHKENWTVSGLRHFLIVITKNNVRGEIISLNLMSLLLTSKALVACDKGPFSL